MKTLGEVLQISIAYLKEKHIENPRRQAEAIFSQVLGLDRLNLYMNFDRPLSEPELDACREALKRRGKGEPFEYIFPEIEFYGCKIKITPAVIIPRQETEILLDKAVSLLKDLDLKGKTAWDVCCGSGCLGIGLKKRFPDLQVVLSDLSPEALEVAKENARRNQIELDFRQGDLLAPFAGQKADIFFCNPPYLSETEYPALDREVRDFEPKRALVSGPTGLEFYERLSNELKNYLNPGAKVFFEIGTGQGEALHALFTASCWKTKLLEKDWAGHDRFFFLEFQTVPHL